jgi:hypothetical protein
MSDSFAMLIDRQVHQERTTASSAKMRQYFQKFDNFHGFTFSQALKP